MKQKLQSAAIWLSLVGLFLSACEARQIETDPAPVFTNTAAATNTPLPPTATPTNTPVPPTPTPEFVQFYTEDFEKDLKYWPSFVVDHSGLDPLIAEVPSEKVLLNIADGFVKFDIGKTWQYAYAIYEPFDYDEVRLDVRAENLGNNNNSISLVCHYTKDSGWYEFNVANSGLFTILYAKVRPQDGYVSYTLIAEGGSNKIKQGHNVNEYRAICQSNTLSLYINDNLTKETKDDRLVSGKVGISVSSFLSLPVQVNFDWIKISQP